jgi:hypothetical protein
LEDNLPVNVPFRRIPFHLRDDVSQHTKDMLEKGIIRPSHSDFSAPIVMVKKKDGTSRFCVDFRALNKKTQKDNYRIVKLDETLDALHGSKVYSTIDLEAGYYQLRVQKDDQRKTALLTHEGLFEFKVMPFGLVSAPSTFQRGINGVVSDLKNKCCQVYLDDLITYSQEMRSHLEHLRDVFSRLQKAGFLSSRKNVFSDFQRLLISDF